jgi:hypothetical protein
MPKKTYSDPLTGDLLTKGETISWKLQGLIRNWYFPGFYTALTLACFIAWPVWRHNPLDVWNYFASLLAIVIESTVGIAMFSQTLRDAVKLRAVEKRIIQLEAKIDTLLARYE